MHAELVKLKTAKWSETQEKQRATHIRYYNELMIKLGENLKPTPDRALKLITDMKFNKYTAKNICCVVFAIQRHPEGDLQLAVVASDEQVKIAMRKIKQDVMQKEDTRLPMTPDMIREMC